MFYKSIRFTPYYIKLFVLSARSKNKEFRLCKLILIKKNVTIDVFTHIKDYLADDFIFGDYYDPPNKIVILRSHLFNIQAVTNVDEVIAISKRHNDTRTFYHM